jgi:hypothetical protein
MCVTTFTRKDMHCSDERAALWSLYMMTAEQTSGIEEEPNMELWKNDVSDSSQPLASAGNTEKDRQPVHRRPVGLTISVEKLDRVLADVQARIATLELERTNLGLVRGELARMEAKWRSA